MGNPGPPGTAVRVLELTEQVAAPVLAAAVQGGELRGVMEGLNSALRTTCAQLREVISFLTEDRATEKELRLCLEVIRNRAWRLYQTE